MLSAVDRPLDTLAIVGVGLIGGSIGLAARRFGIARWIVGVGRQQSSLDEALAVGAIDAGMLEPAEAVVSADFVVFCTPVDQIAGQVIALAPGCRPGTVITDAGSTKSVIVRCIDGKLPAEVDFVGSHPLAGSEKRGPRFADPLLFQDRLTVVTPTAQTRTGALERVRWFWQSLGSRVRVLDPDEHDRALAMTSHLPHLLAAALAGILPESLREFAATGFRDTTRIAAGDPLLWTAIFAQNRTALLRAFDLIEDRLSEFKSALIAQDWDGITCLLAEGKRSRDALGS